MNIFNINLRKKANLRISWLFLLLFCFFLSWLPGDVIGGTANKLEHIIEGIEFSESFLLNGRIELSSRLEIIDDYDKESGAVTQSYLMNQDFIWIFKDKKWRIEQQMKDSNGNEYYNIQVFDGEKKTDLNVDIKMATISNDSRYASTMHGRMYGSPRHYMLGLFGRGTVSEDLKKCQKVELIGTEKIDSIDCSVIKFVYDKKYSGSLWVAPSRGYRVIESDFHIGSIQCIRLARDLKEWSEGVWLPTRGSFRVNLLKDGEVIPQVKVHFSVNNVELKKEISEDFFQLKFPPGTAVINKMTNTVYRVPEPEETPSEEELFKIARKAKEGKYTKVSLPSSTSPDDSNELVSRSLSRWFVGGIILVLLSVITLIVVILFMIRRRKSNSTNI